MSRPSQRFQPSAWMQRLVPFLLVLILLGLLAVLGIIILSVTGVLGA
ncbi:MAG TPA: hypothetical protein VLM83_02595 [Anaerolineales bacterium]|jgi:hypothetical protein|nr:hypothetical protein [Anaerolineales bacterium]